MACHQAGCPHSPDPPGAPLPGSDMFSAPATGNARHYGDIKPARYEVTISCPLWLKADTADPGITLLYVEHICHLQLVSVALAVKQAAMLEQ